MELSISSTDATLITNTKKAWHLSAKPFLCQYDCVAQCTPLIMHGCAVYCRCGVRLCGKPPRLYSAVNLPSGEITPATPLSVASKNGGSSRSRCRHTQILPPPCRCRRAAQARVFRLSALLLAACANRLHIHKACAEIVARTEQHLSLMVAYAELAVLLIHLMVLLVFLAYAV